MCADRWLWSSNMVYTSGRWSSNLHVGQGKFAVQSEEFLSRSRLDHAGLPLCEILPLTIFMPVKTTYTTQNKPTLWCWYVDTLGHKHRRRKSTMRKSSTIVMNKCECSWIFASRPCNAAAIPFYRVDLRSWTDWGRGPLEQGFFFFCQ